LNYSPAVTTLTNELRHAGDVAGLPYRGVAGSVAAGARVVFGARLHDGRLDAVRFAAYGCPEVIAAAEWWCRRVTGVRVDELPIWDNRDIADELGVPPGKLTRLLIIEDAWQALAAEWCGNEATE
jgi:NifU-like protein involved in Fe-S cluster formation